MNIQAISARILRSTGKTFNSAASALKQSPYPPTTGQIVLRSSTATSSGKRAATTNDFKQLGSQFGRSSGTITRISLRTSASAPPIKRAVNSDIIESLERTLAKSSASTPEPIELTSEGSSIGEQRQALEGTLERTTSGRPALAAAIRLAAKIGPKLVASPQTLEEALPLTTRIREESRARLAEIAALTTSAPQRTIQSIVEEAFEKPLLASTKTSAEVKAAKPEKSKTTLAGFISRNVPTHLAREGLAIGLAVGLTSISTLGIAIPAYAAANLGIKQLIKLKDTNDNLKFTNFIEQISNGTAPGSIHSIPKDIQKNTNYIYTDMKGSGLIFDICKSHYGDQLGTARGAELITDISMLFLQETLAIAREQGLSNHIIHSFDGDGFNLLGTASLTKELQERLPIIQKKLNAKIEQLLQSERYKGLDLSMALKQNAIGMRLVNATLEELALNGAEIQIQMVETNGVMKPMLEVPQNLEKGHFKVEGGGAFKFGNFLTGAVNAKAQLNEIINTALGKKSDSSREITRNYINQSFELTPGVKAIGMLIALKQPDEVVAKHVREAIDKVFGDRTRRDSVASKYLSTKILEKFILEHQPSDLLPYLNSPDGLRRIIEDLDHAREQFDEANIHVVEFGTEMQSKRLILELNKLVEAGVLKAGSFSVKSSDKLHITKVVGTDLLSDAAMDIKYNVWAENIEQATDILRARGLQPKEIEEHLAQCTTEGRPFNPELVAAKVLTPKEKETIQRTRTSENILFKPIRIADMFKGVKEMGGLVREVLTKKYERAMMGERRLVRA